MKNLIIKISKGAMLVYTSLALLPILILPNFKFRDYIIERLMIALCKTLESKSNYFISFNLRAKEKEYKVNKIRHSHVCEYKIGIILQGPLDANDDFTENTVKLYKSLHPNIKIIISTWDTEDEELCARLEKIGAFVVRSKKPEIGSGIGNVNLQLASMQAGIRLAKDLNCDYIAKTRTDQRIYQENAIFFMIELIKNFPKTGPSRLKNRIIALGDQGNTFYFPYFISDFIYFGNTEDMEKFLQLSYDKRQVRPPFTTHYERVANKSNAEIYIMKGLSEIVADNIDTSVSNYWKFIKDNLILIDKKIIDLYWHKYDDRYCEHRRNHTVHLKYINYGGAECNFTEWLLLLKDKIKKHENIDKE